MTDLLCIQDNQVDALTYDKSATEKQVPVLDADKNRIKFFLSYHQSWTITVRGIKLRTWNVFNQMVSQMALQILKLA